MKTMKVIKIIPVVLMGLFLSINTGAVNVSDESGLNAEPTVNMESWMFDTSYLSEAEQSMETWMFDASWLDEATAESTLENWMLDEDYLDVETPAVEPWMLDAGYLNQ